MEEFLKNSRISEEGIKLYSRIIGFPSLKWGDLKLYLSDLPDEQFNSVIEELVDNNLLLPIEGKDLSRPQEFIPNPPLDLINKYYMNITSNISSIHSRIMEHFNKSSQKIIDHYETEENETLHQQFTEIFKDYESLSIVQKQDMNDLIEKLNQLNTQMKNQQGQVVKTVIEHLESSSKTMEQTISDIRAIIGTLMEHYNLKKNKEEFLNEVEQQLKIKFNEILVNNAQEIKTIVEKEQDKGVFEHLLTQTVQYQTDLKLILLNLLNVFELKLTQISSLLKSHKERNENNIKNLKQEILSTISSLLDKSIEDIIGLNEPIKLLLTDYMRKLMMKKVPPKKEEEPSLQKKEIMMPRVPPKKEISKVKVKPSSIKFSAPCPTVKKLETLKKEETTPMKPSVSSHDLVLVEKEVPKTEVKKEPESIGMMFNNLVKNLKNLKSNDFSRQLQGIADKILEEKG
ncbi:MAG: hypothetical protein ACTSYC_11545, partial [Promethearchaeota archaeon]